MGEWQTREEPGAERVPEPRHGWRPAPPEPGPTRGLVAGIAAIVVTVSAALGLLGYHLAVDVMSRPVARPFQSPSAARSSPSTPVSATGSPTVLASPAQGPDEWRLPARSWTPLPAADPASPLFGAQSTPLDDVAPVVLTGCPEPVTTATEEAWRRAVTAQWDCVHAAWVPEFAELGWPSAAPAVEFFHGDGADSECGYLEAPAFYCASGAGRVYFGAGHYSMATTWDLSVNEMVNHEYSHHLQNLSGVTATKLRAEHSAELERRAELQATCWSAMMTFHNRAVAFNERDLASWMERLDTMLVDGVHGSRESILYWGTRGLYAETLGDCNTWLAPPEMVS